MKNLISFLFLISISYNCLFAQGYSPYRSIKYVDDGIIVTYDINNSFYIQDQVCYNTKFWIIPSFQLNDIEGEPAFPFRWDVYMLPFGKSVKLDILNYEYSDTTLLLSPAQSPVLTREDNYEKAITEMNYYMGFFPQNILSLSDINQYRGQKIFNVIITPVQYDMEHGIVRFYKKIVYKLSFINDINPRVPDKTDNIFNTPNTISLSDYYLRNTAVNYSFFYNQSRDSHNRSINYAQPDNRSYLIITTNSLINAAEKLANWKRVKGMNVIIETRDHWVSVDSVKNVIKKHYNQDSIMYVLNLGGINEIPADTIDFMYEIYGQTVNYDHLSDLKYSLMDDDQIVDIYIGRIPVSTLNEAIIVINKIIDYESNPPLDSSFYKNALHCAFFQDTEKWGITDSGQFGWINGKDSIEDRLFVVTSELIKDYIEQYGINVNRVYNTDSLVYPIRWSTRYSILYPTDYPNHYISGDTIPIYLQKDPSDSTHVQWNGDSLDIINEINRGCFYVFHRDHGADSAWVRPFFSTKHISMLQNNNKLPVVFSINCLTGQYNYSNCFAKNFLTKDNGGCVGIFAASKDSFSPINDRLALAMFNSIWPTQSQVGVTPSYELAQILNLGLSNTNYSHNKYYQYTREIFHCFGDPSMMIYTDKPVAISTPSIRVNNNIINVQTTDGDARISFYTPGTTPLVDSYLGSSVDYTTTADSVIICIDRHNYIPYVVTYHKNEFIQNETINDTRTYVGKNIKIGRNVTNTIPVGNVVIDGADVLIQGGNVVIQNGTTITNSNVVINPK